MTYFVDTSFWAALLNRRDQDHRRARAWQRYVVAHRVRLVSSEAVLWELLDGLSATPLRARAIELWRQAEAASQVEVVPFGEDPTRAAASLYEGRSDKEWGITDCSSFVGMNQRAITAALTLDHHFEQAGFDALLRRDPPAA